ncbi:transmembrane amino acid transporter protein domain-containing protein [Ditylenchus destructor]|uniref:Transmembrane amino acid transporter protein domain-containing protein n=1 Tax=Ditylenchus destructor TaxID=166010 RepID=A0AAD4RDW8_9BILA|nr:transmembrane amino acid transporter protein domain-containing protein [Ditylenchus destructor]
MTLVPNDERIEGRIRQTEPENSAIVPGNMQSSSNVEEMHLFADRPHNANSITPEQAFVHMVKAMLGTGLLSLPYAFQHSGLYLGLILLVLICIVCLYCMRQIVFAAHFVCRRNGRELIDYANIMRGAVEAGPSWISGYGYFFKQLVNVKMFIAQLGFCCVYFVFMADNLKDFFDKNTEIHIGKGVWMLILLIPILSICSIRKLRVLAPFAFIANIIYLVAVAIVVYYFFTHLQPASQLTKFGKLRNLPLFFGTVMFAFEGVCVVMPIENRMERPQFFIAWNGVLNSSCLTVLAIFAVTGFYGYLTFGDDIKETVTLNLPQEPFFEALKIMFVLCVMVSYPLQFFVPMERIEKFITRKCAVEKHIRNVYFARFSMVLITCAIAEIVPHLALFISLVGAVACTSLALLFPPIIDLLVCYAQNNLTLTVYIRNFGIFLFAIIGFTTGTYSALYDIAQTFSQ